MNISMTGTATGMFVSGRGIGDGPNESLSQKTLMLMAEPHHLSPIGATYG